MSEYVEECKRKPIGFFDPRFELQKVCMIPVLNMTTVVLVQLSILKERKRIVP